MITEVRTFCTHDKYRVNRTDEQVQENADKWAYCWLFEVGNMRNAHLKIVRKLWKECVPRFHTRLLSSSKCQFRTYILWTRGCYG